MKTGNVYTCPKCGSFLFEFSGVVVDATARLKVICRGRCRKPRTVRLSDGSLVGESGGPTLPQPLRAHLLAA